MGFFSSKKEHTRDVSPSGSDTSASNLSVGSYPSTGSSPLTSRGSSPAAPARNQSSTTALSCAEAQFRDTFNNGLYTSLVMLDFLITRRGLRYEDYLRDRTIVLDKHDHQEYRTRVSSKKQSKEVQPHEFRRTKAWLQGIHDSEFSPLVDNGTGRCTSFAIQTVSRLDRRYPRSYTFNYYKLGVHHLARCVQSGVVIDSSSKQGAFVLRPGQEMSVISIDPDYSNKWVFLSPSVSRFTKTKRNSSSRPIQESEAPVPTSWREAMHNCLIDMACKEQVLIYFRAYNQTDRPQYHGMIKFLLKDRMEIVLSETAGARYPHRFIFGGGNPQTERDCRHFLSGWIEFGAQGHSYRDQYKKCEHVVQKIWAAAIKLYGYPQFTRSTLGVPVEGARTAMAGIWTPGESTKR